MTESRLEREVSTFLGSETLEQLLEPLVDQLDGPLAWCENEWTTDPTVREALLVFCDEHVADGHARELILDEIAGRYHTSAAIGIALSHGACVNAALRSLAQYCETDCTAWLEDAGAFLVGADVLDTPVGYYDYRTPSRLSDTASTCVAPSDCCTRPHDGAMGRWLLLRSKALLASGFVDADARKEDGSTPLMVMAFDAPRPDIASTLLEESSDAQRNWISDTQTHYVQGRQ